MSDTLRISELVRHWQGEIAAGKAYKKKYARPQDWERYKEYYRGNWKGKEEIPVNKVFSYFRTLIPRTYFRGPLVSVTPTRARMEWHARIVESIDNYLIRELNVKKTLKRAILDAGYGGVGPVKLGFDSEFGYLEKLATLPAGETVSQTSDKQERARIEYRTNIKPGMPWAVPVTPMDVITPWGYRDPQEFPWVTHEYLRPLRDVKQDAKYNKAEREKLKGGWTRDADDPRAGQALLSADYRPPPLCMLREVRDYKHKRFLVLCEDQLLLETEDLLQIEGLPWEFLIFNEDPDHFWGLPDIKMVEAQQLELNQIRTQAMKHRRIAMLKILYKVGAIKEDQLNKLLSEDIEALAVEDMDASLQNVVMSLQNHIPPDLWREAENALNDFRETLGFSRNESGEFRGGTPPSAHEVVAVGQAAEIRTDERKDAVADLLVNIVRKWNQFIFKFWDKPRVSKIVGPDGAQYWITYTGKELEAEYNLNIDPDSGMPITRALKQQQAERVFAALRVDPFIDPIKLREMFLKQFDWIDPSWPLIMKNPEALKMMQQGETLGAKPGAGGAGGNGRDRKTYGKPTKPMTVEQLIRGGA